MVTLPMPNDHFTAGSTVRWGNITATVLIRRKKLKCEICGVRNKTALNK